MKRDNPKNYYSKLYSSSLEDVEKNLGDFINQKEKDYLNKHFN